MATKHIFLSDLNFYYKLCLSELAFYLAEIKIYEDHLAEVAQKWTDKSVKAEVEHFQNQFIVQREQNDILTHEFNIRMVELSDYAKSNATAVNHIHFDNHNAFLSKISERVESYKKIFGELKSDFRRFLSKYL